MKSFISIIVVGLLVLVAGCSSLSPEISNFEECVEAGNPVMESYPRQCSSQGQVFVEELTMKETCENFHNGTWIESAQECEMISQNACSQMNGTFNECGSACRNDPNATVCTLQCVPYCSFQ